jgi:hypothetical protein
MFPLVSLIFALPMFVDLWIRKLLQMLMLLGVMKGRPKPSVKAVVMRTIVDHETMPKRNDYKRYKLRLPMKLKRHEYQSLHNIQVQIKIFDLASRSQLA